MKKITHIFDVDGTLIDPKTYQVPDTTLTTLQKLHADGYPCCIATGRSFESLMNTMIKDIIPWHGYICSNGQHVLDCDGKTIFKYHMNPNNVHAAVKLAKSLNINIQFQGNVSFLLRPADDVVVKAHQFFHEPIPQLCKEYENEDLDMLMMYHHDKATLELFRTIPGLTVFQGQSTYADVVDQGQSKFKGIKHYFKHKDSPITYVAYGDSDNDIEMLEHATLAVALGNASEELKKRAHIICPRVDEDGLMWGVNAAFDIIKSRM